MKTKTFRQTVTFPKAKPLEVYSLIMDAKKHSAFTGSKVSMSDDEVDGKFEVYDGYGSGFNIELKPGKKIVQGWHFKEDGWPDDHFSICTFIFSKVSTGTKLSFTQAAVPEHKEEALKEGWKLYYWNPMKAYLLRKHTK